MSAPRTLYDKIFDDHVVQRDADGTCLLYIDRHLVHEVTSPQAFEGLRMTGRKVRHPERTLAVVDHNVPTSPDRKLGINRNEESRIQIAALAQNAADFGVEYYSENDVRQGIVHIIGPEQGFTLPGMTIGSGVGWAMSPFIDTTLILKALAMALLHRDPPANLLCHSDRGVQYASADYRAALTKAGFIASMSRKGNCYDNAFIESFWSTLKLDLVYRTEFATRQQAQREIFDYIERFYNRQRSHTALGCLSPVDFELQNN